MTTEEIYNSDPTPEDYTDNDDRPLIELFVKVSLNVWFPIRCTPLLNLGRSVSGLLNQNYNCYCQHLVMY